MPTTVHVLRPESVTPIQLYLDRVRRDAASPVEFACVLLYREREYRTLYASSWRPDHLPAAGSDTPFAPYGLTRDAADAIAGEIRRIWGIGGAASAAPPDDLFGLKEEALRRLRDARLKPYGRRSRKNACISSRHSASHTPAITSKRWLCPGSSPARTVDATAPVRGSAAP